MDCNRTIRIGTRGSKLALWQADHVSGLISSLASKIKIEIKVIKTTGDKILDTPLSKIGGKGLFLKEIEDALIENEIDCAVHSLKDVPTELPNGLEIVAILERESPEDVLVSQQNLKFEDLPPGAIIGSSSLRRLCQLKRRRSDLVYKDLRGNVDTRLKKLDEGEFTAIVLAHAGLKRLGLKNRISQVLDLIPAVAQGAIGIEVRSNDQELKQFLKPLNHSATEVCVTAERAFLKVVQGGCQVPVGCHAFCQGNKIFIEAFISDLEGKVFLYEQSTDQVGGSVPVRMAQSLLDKGGKNILESLFLANSE